MQHDMTGLMYGIGTALLVMGSLTVFYCGCIVLYNARKRSKGQ